MVFLPVFPFQSVLFNLLVSLLVRKRNRLHYTHANTERKVLYKHLNSPANIYFLVSYRNVDKPHLNIIHFPKILFKLKLTKIYNYFLFLYFIYPLLDKSSLSLLSSIPQSIIMKDMRVTQNHLCNVIIVIVSQYFLSFGMSL